MLEYSPRDINKYIIQYNNEFISGNEMEKFCYSKGEIVKGEKLKSENALADSSLLEKEIYGEKLIKNIVSYAQKKVYIM